MKIIIYILCFVPLGFCFSQYTDIKKRENISDSCKPNLPSGQDSTKTDNFIFDFRIVFPKTEVYSATISVEQELRERKLKKKKKMKEKP